MKTQNNLLPLWMGVSIKTEHVFDKLGYYLRFSLDEEVKIENRVYDRHRSCATYAHSTMMKIILEGE